jgi:hypothetical protein
MSVEEKFYLLVLDEVRAQPDLVTSLPLDLESYARKFAGCSLDEAIERLDERQPCGGGDGFEALSLLGELPTSLGLDLSALRERLTMDLEQDYHLLCREALLNLLWQNRHNAEQRINLAKYLRDEWAFAHFVYGLLRGVAGNLGRAHFELYLAINRETFACARARVERALDLVR